MVDINSITNVTCDKDDDYDDILKAQVEEIHCAQKSLSVTLGGD